MKQLKNTFIFLLCSVLLLSLPACDSQKANTNEELEVSAANKSVDKERSVKSTGSSDTRKPSHFIIGTGSVEGVYYPIAGVICRLLNRHKETHNVRCSVESTGGSVYNLKELRQGNFDIVVAQSDWQYHAYKGSSAFEKDGPNEELRAVFSLEADPLALIVRKDSEIKGFNDLKDKKVSLGYTRSLQYRIISHLLEVKEWDEETFAAIDRMKDSKQIAALCESDIDAALFFTSSLTDYLKTLPENCELKFVPIASDNVDKVIAEVPYLRKGAITHGRFLGATEDIPSFGLGATFVTQASTSPKAIYHITKEIVENFKDFQSLHPSLHGLDKQDLPYAGITAPLHSGALRYYKEARLLKK